MLLQDKLDALKAECLAKTPPKVTLVRQRAVEGLAASGLAERAMHAGEQAPAFQLRDGYGGAFSSREALRRGPIVLVFYRGNWCSYCNIDLRAIESASHDIRSLGASLVVVWQQTPRNSLETQRRNELSFSSLVDAGGKSRTLSAEGLRRIGCRRGGLRHGSRGLQRRSELDVDHAGPVRRGARRDHRVRRQQRRLHAARRPVRTDAGPPTSPAH